MFNLRFRKYQFILAFAIILLNPWLSAQTIVSGSFNHGGINRTYRLYIPEIYNPSEPVPLLFNLHGYGSNNIEQEFYGDFRPIADTANFIIAHPNGTIDFTGVRSWNTFGFSQVDDVGFLSALIDTISNAYNIDPNRIYSTGMSNGGFMSYDLACFLSHRITAVASVTGSMLLTRFQACQPTHPLPVMQIHGTADGTVPYNGNLLFSPIDTLVHYWVQFNNCLPEPEIIPVPDIDPLDGCTAERHIFHGGDGEVMVEFFKVFGGGHSWPGAPVNINITNMDFSASVEIWRFLRQFSLDQLVAGNRPLSKSSGIKIFPNPATTKLSVIYPADSRFGVTRLEVVDVYGRKMFSQPVAAGQQILELNVSRWKPGLYLVLINDGSNILMREKLIIR